MKKIIIPIGKYFIECFSVFVFVIAIVSCGWVKEHTGSDLLAGMALFLPAFIVSVACLKFYLLVDINDNIKKLDSNFHKSFNSKNNDNQSLQDVTAKLSKIKKQFDSASKQFLNKNLSVSEKLEKLKSLREKKIISEEEYLKEKNKILNGI